MIRLLLSTAAVLLGASAFTACASMPPPFGTPIQEYRGFKSRTFVGTPADVRPAVMATLREMGYEVHQAGDEVNFLSANRGMDGASASGSDAPREWTRVGVEVRHIDKHRRAPRTLVTIDAEIVNGSSSGVIEAGFGAVTSDFYQAFFASVEQRVDAARPRPIRGFLPPS